MAEHLLRPRNADHRVSVGWDPEIGYWARVYDRKEGGKLIDAVGVHIEDPITDIIVFRKRVWRYGHLGEADRKELLAQRDAGRVAS